MIHSDQARYLHALDKEYTERVRGVAGVLEGCLQGVARDPILLQLARDSGSAVHINTRLTEIVDKCLRNEQERTARAALQRAVSIESRNEELVKEVEILKESLYRQPVVHQQQQQQHQQQQQDQQQQVATGLENQLLKTEISRLENQIKELSQLHQQQSQIAETNQCSVAGELSELRSQNTWLKADRNRTGQHYEQVASQIKTALDRKILEVEDLREQYKVLADDHDSLKEAHQKLAQKYLLLKSKTDTTSQQHLDKDQKITLLKERLRGLMSENRKFESDLTMVKSEFHNVQHQVRMEREAGRGGRREDVSVKRLLDESLHAVLEEAKEKQRRQARDQTVDTEAILSNERKGFQIEQLKATLTTAKSTIARLEKECSDSSAQLERVTAQAQTDLIDLTAQLKEAVMHRSKLEKEMQDLRLRLAEAEKDSDLKEQQYVAAVEAHKLKEEADKLRYKLTAAKEISAESKRVELDNIALSQQYGEVKRKLQIAEETVADITQQVENLKSVNSALQRSLETEKEYRLLAQQQLEEVLQEKKMDDHHGEAELEKLQREVLELRVKASTTKILETRIKDAESQLAQALRMPPPEPEDGQKIQELNQVIATLQAQHQGDEQALRECQALISTERKCNADLQQSLAMMEAEVREEAYRSEREEEVRSKLLSANYEGNKKYQNEIQKDMQKLRIKMGSLSDDLKTAEEDNRSLRKEVQKYRGEGQAQAPPPPPPPADDECVLDVSSGDLALRSELAKLQQDNYQLRTERNQLSGSLGVPHTFASQPSSVSTAPSPAPLESSFGRTASSNSRTDLKGAFIR